jgi:hypothetical protein
MTRWLTRMLPELTVVLTQPDSGTLPIQLQARWQRTLSMREPEVQVWRGDRDPNKDPAHTIQRGEVEESAFTPIPLMWSAIHTTDGNGRKCRIAYGVRPGSPNRHPRR